MVKRWLPSRPKAKKEATNSSPTGDTRVGTRALRPTLVGGNLLVSLRERIVKRPKPQALTAVAAVPSDEAPVAPVVVQSTSTNSPSSWGVKQPTAPKPPPGSDDGESGVSEDEDEAGQDGADRVQDPDVAREPKKKKKASKRLSLGFNRWVPKLLDPVEKHRDKIHRKKKKHLLAPPQGPPPIFTDSKQPYVVLLSRILAFLDPLEPARVTAYVNKSTAAGVRAFYELYCPPPRPRRYLVNRIWENRQSVFPAKVMQLLPIHDRVRASASCFSFYEACNALPLEFEGASAIQQFLTGFQFPRTGRIHKRFKKTPALLFNGANAVDVMNVIQLLERGNDGDDNDPDDDSDCFAAVKEISLHKVSGLSAEKGKYFEQLLQTLFMDHVNSRLQTLELIDLALEDLQFKHLARLWRDARFPALRRLSLANNAFSSRYVRDWIWSFENERFLTLEAIDMSTLYCLSVNDAVTAKPRAFAQSVLVCYSPQITRIVDVSGNPLSDPKAANQLARVFMSSTQLPSGWPELMQLNFSSMHLGDKGLRTIATAILENQATRIQLLDISDNGIRASIDTFVRVLSAGKLLHLRSLAIADNDLGALEFEALSSALATNCCPRLQVLDLSSNCARGEGIARFCPFLLSPPAKRLWALDLSDNEIPHSGLLRLNETLTRGNCQELHELNLSRNAELKAIVSFLDLIRGEGLPSLTVLQVGYAQTRSEGRDLVQDTLRRRSVQELRRLKQLRFEERLTAIQLENDAKAERDQLRCRRQTQRLREVYDHLENEADRALRRRKQLKNSSQLHIHQEITRQKQQRAHARLCRQLDLDVHTA
ncbi:Leucine-rich repeat [Phytophthora cinnamomi]|uniref:Leucine-rich repeat n=1 Tax=Phytophthora cinnamomi TaxID=4785 RepID=UPI00355A220B|nr:Leucine-rich repeat [Phytophthora cinnamomi]